jgi:hypothetical protein
MNLPYSPFTCVIKGDIARADTVGLHMLCQGRSVVEFGVGASTMILARSAKPLITYDTSELWISKTQKNIAQLDHKTCEPEFVKFNEKSIPTCPPCEVLWIDGLPSARLAFALQNFDQSSEMVILHGALRNRNSFGHRILSETLQEKWEMIKSVELGYLDSHLLVLHKRKKPLIYYNYHQTEAGNHRVPC